MKFRNPWIDPRVAQIGIESIQGYLMDHGWRLVGPATNPSLLRFEKDNGDEDSPTLFLPVQQDNGAGWEWTIELIGELAQFEDRWAVDVVSDILKKSNDKVAPKGACDPPLKGT